MPLQTSKKSTSTQQLQAQQVNPQKQTNQHQSKKQPTKTDRHNLKDENGEWIQSIFSESKSSVH